MSTAVEADKSIDVGEFLRILHGESFFEVRSPKCPEWAGASKLATATGFFSDIEAAIREVQKLDAELKPPAVYCSLNPIKPAMIAKAHNRIKFGIGATSKEDIERRTAIMIDIDPVRPSGVSSTKAQMLRALAMADKIDLALTDLGWPAPLRGMSGNGSYLIYRIDLPNDAESEALIRDCLVALDARFSDHDSDPQPQAKVDTSTFDANRICKVLGTVARKGDSVVGVPGVEDMPHRRSYFVPPESPLEPVPVDLLRDLAATAPKEEKPTPKANHASSYGNHLKGEWIDNWIRSNNIDVSNPQPLAGGGRKWIYRSLPGPCTLHPGGHEADGSGFIIERADGSIAAGCRHERCTWDWAALRTWHEPDAYNKRQQHESKSDVASASAPFIEHQSRNGAAKPERKPVEDRREFWTKRGKKPPVPFGELRRANLTVDFLVDRCLVRNMSALIAGKSKAMKTGISLNLALSLASGKPFLNEFHVKQKCRVLIVSAESGEAVIRRNLIGWAEHMDIDLDSIEADGSLFCMFWAPKISNADMIDYFADCLDEIKPDVVILDPLYLSLEGESASNLSQNADQIDQLSSLILSRGATPIFNDHVKRGSNNAKEHKQIELDDVSGAGKSEYFRQWILLGRRSQFLNDESLTKNHDLWLSVGGSAGFSSSWGLDITETFDDRFESVSYSLELRPASQVIDSPKVRADDAQARKEKLAEEAFASKVERATTFFKTRPNELLVKSDVRNELRVNNDTAGQVLHHLETTGVIQKNHETIRRGNVNTDAWRLSGTLIYVDGQSGTKVDK